MFLLILAGGGALWMGGKFFYKLHDYFALSSSQPAIVSEWTILEDKPGKFSVSAAYQFNLGERVIYGTYHFPKPIYPNPYVAEDLIEHWKEKSWLVWYSEKNPTIGALERGVPIKEGIQLALCMGVFLYFLFLQVYIKRVDPLPS